MRRDLRIYMNLMTLVMLRDEGGGMNAAWLFGQASFNFFVKSPMKCLTAE